MNAKLVFILAGALAVGGCNLIPDATVFPYPKEQVQKMLLDARTTLPRRDGGKDMINIWGAYRSGRGVKLNMKYASSAPQLECEAVVTAVTPQETRVVADCGKSNSDSAISRTQDALRAPMFEEHIASTLNKRAFNRSKADLKERAAVFENLGGMQREALQMSVEARRMAVEHSR